MKASKAHLEYWKSKLKKQKLPQNEWETSGAKKNWEIYLQVRGRREWFNLGTPNKDAAAKTARDVYETCKGGSDGWDRAIERFKPEVARLAKLPTVGEFLAAVEKHCTLQPITLHTYSRKLRQLVADIQAYSQAQSKFDYKKGGSKAWRAQIEATSIGKITLPALQAWKKRCLANAEQDPKSQARTRRTINSSLRNAKSLFAEKVLKVLPFHLARPLPFEGVDFEKVRTPRYHSTVDIAALIVAARAELCSSEPDTYKAFLLATYVGLRRNEIDGLQWLQIDFAKHRLQIATTEYTHVKTADSEQEVDIFPDVCAELESLKASSFSSFVIDGPGQYPKPPLGGYRCADVFARLIQWLRRKGVTDPKPIHMLRKEFGTAIAMKYGIFAASQALRHSNIHVTREHYVDKKQAIYPDFRSHSPECDKFANG